MTSKKEAAYWKEKMKNLQARQIKMANTVRVNRELNSKIIDRFVALKHCSLLTNKKYFCEKLKGYDLKKGKEIHCHSPDFINCPAFNQYVSHELIQNRRKINSNNQKNGTN